VKYQDCYTIVHFLTLFFFKGPWSDKMRELPNHVVRVRSGLARDNNMNFFIVLHVLQVKLKLSLCLPIKYYGMKAHGGVYVWIHIYLTSALAGGEWPASRPCRFTPRKRAPGTH
jgi:hypothetical protein